MSSCWRNTRKGLRRIGRKKKRQAPFLFFYNDLAIKR